MSQQCLSDFKLNIKEYDTVFKGNKTLAPKNKIFVEIMDQKFFEFGVIFRICSRQFELLQIVENVIVFSFVSITSRCSLKVNR